MGLREGRGPAQAGAGPAAQESCSSTHRACLGAMCPAQPSGEQRACFSPTLDSQADPLLGLAGRTPGPTDVNPLAPSVQLLDPGGEEAAHRPVKP